MHVQTSTFSSPIQLPPGSIACDEMSSIHRDTLVPNLKHRPPRFDSIQRLVKHYRKPLKVYFERRVFDSAEAEDLTQEVFLRLVAKPMLCEVRNLEAFLFRTALNLIRDHSRRSKVRHSSLRQFGEMQGEHDFATPERLAIARESLGAISDKLKGVGPKSWSIFLLHRIDGLDYRQISAVSGISVSAVEKHMTKVLTRLSRYR